jgi:hypothetical protein
MTNDDPHDDAAARAAWAALPRLRRTRGPCPDAATMGGYLEGRADAAVADAIASHLATCPACLDAVIDLRALGIGRAPVRAAPRPLVFRAAGWSAVAAAVAVAWLSGVAMGGMTEQGRTVIARASAQPFIAGMPDPLGDAGRGPR